MISVFSVFSVAKCFFQVDISSSKFSAVPRNYILDLIYRDESLIVVNKPAVPAHEGINPFTKQKQMFAAKPARRVVKIRPLKKLKDLVG